MYTAGCKKNAEAVPNTTRSDNNLAPGKNVKGP